jgi:bifunctional ADP-heptose synthase (sugar kinase/adenylyltransferase)
MLDEATLKQILDRFPNLSIAVVGDLFLDKYLDLDSSLTEISVETGIEAYQITRVRCYPGAGGTVLNNLRALGVGKLVAVSVIGEDGEGYELLRALRAQRVETDDVIVSPQRMTPTYTKPMLSQPEGPARELNRLDIKNRHPQPAELDRQIIERLDRVVPTVDAVIVADQVTERNRGVVSDAVRDHLAHLALKHPRCRIFADSRSHIGLFRNVIAKPNQHELVAALRRPAGEGVVSAAETRRLTELAAAESHKDMQGSGGAAHAEVAVNARQLSARINGPVFATVGAAGILYVDKAGVEHIPGVPVSGPIDIVGAGDSTMSGIASALCAGATPPQAARIGCLVASLTIQQLGVTGTATPAQVLSRHREADSWNA